MASADPVRAEAARLALALIRFAGGAAHPFLGSARPELGRAGVGHFTFGPSWRPVARDDVEAFLVGLPGPALIVQTTVRGMLWLTLTADLDGERRQWAEKTASNFVAGVDEMQRQLGLTDASRVLVEFDEESHVFSLAAVRHYAQHFPVDVGWNLGPIEDGDADAVMHLIPADQRAVAGRSGVTRAASGADERVALMARGWIQAWQRMDLDWLREVLAPDFVHTSPFGRFEDRDSYLAAVEPAARKSVAELVIRKVIAQGNEATVWFENRTPKGVVDSCDWVRVAGSHIVEIRSFYDPTAIRAVLPPDDQASLDGGY